MKRLPQILECFVVTESSRFIATNHFLESSSFFNSNEWNRTLSFFINLQPYAEQHVPFYFLEAILSQKQKVAYDLLLRTTVVTSYNSNLQVSWKCIWGHKQCKGFKILSFNILAWDDSLLCIYDITEDSYMVKICALFIIMRRILTMS